MNMRNATCVGTQTSKVPTRVTLLFIPYIVATATKRIRLQIDLSGNYVTTDTVFNLGPP